MRIRNSFFTFSFYLFTLANMDDLKLIRENLLQIHARMEAACRRANRNISDVRLLMATKTVTAERIKLAISLENT